MLYWNRPWLYSMTLPRYHNNSGTIIQDAPQLTVLYFHRTRHPTLVTASDWSTADHETWSTASDWSTADNLTWLKAPDWLIRPPTFGSQVPSVMLPTVVTMASVPIKVAVERARYLVQGQCPSLRHAITVHPHSFVVQPQSARTAYNYYLLSTG